MQKNRKTNGTPFAGVKRDEVSVEKVGKDSVVVSYSIRRCLRDRSGKEVVIVAQLFDVSV